MSARSGFRSNRRERGDGFDRDRDESRIDQLRVPPHSVEAEQAVLGGLFIWFSEWTAKTFLVYAIALLPVFP